MYQTTISTDLISRPEIEALVATLRKSTGRVVTVQEQFIIETDDINVTMMMDALRDTLRGPAKVKSSNGHKKVKVAKKQKAAKMSSHARRNVETGEIISVQTLRKMVAAGEISASTLFENSKGERFVVVDHSLIREPQS